MKVINSSGWLGEVEQVVLGGGEMWERYGRVRGRRPSRGWWTMPKPEPWWAGGAGMVKGKGGDGSG